MAKIVIIGRCLDCPHFTEENKMWMTYCNNVKRKVGAYGIPEWCPLDTYEKPFGEELS